jgi:hypothetical protein
MPRFGIKSLLIAFTVVALWLVSSPGILDDEAGKDLRRAILLLILIASGSAAICRAGWQRAFWAGFSGAMLITVAKVPGFGIELYWLETTVGRLLPRDNQGRIYYPVVWTSYLACILLLSTIAGLIAGYI